MKGARPLRRVLTVLAGVVVVAALAALTARQMWFGIGSDVPVLAPPEWSWLDGPADLKTDSENGHLLIRRQTAGLLRSTGGLGRYWEQIERNGDPWWPQKRSRERAAAPLKGIESPSELDAEYCYDYDPGMRQLKRMECSRWHAESGEAAPCSPIRTPPEYVWYLKGWKARDDVYKWLPLVFPGGERIQFWSLAPSVVTCLATHSETGIPNEEYHESLRRCEASVPNAEAVSRASNLVAVVTGTLDERLTIMMLGAPRWGSRRQHYHQLVPLFGDVRRVGRRTRIPMVTNLGDDDVDVLAKPGRDFLIGMGWSPDERFVVYVGRTSLCVVHVDKLGEK